MPVPPPPATFAPPRARLRTRWAQVVHSLFYDEELVFDNVASTASGVEFTAASLESGPARRPTRRHPARNAAPPAAWRARRRARGMSDAGCGRTGATDLGPIQ